MRLPTKDATRSHSAVTSSRRSTAIPPTAAPYESITRSETAVPPAQLRELLRLRLEPLLRRLDALLDLGARLRKLRVQRGGGRAVVARQLAADHHLERALEPARGVRAVREALEHLLEAE